MRRFTKSFNGGEVTPEFWGRLDDPKYQSGLALCKNFIPLPHGPIVNRPGFSFVREVKNSAKKTRLIPFDFGVNQTFAVEIGEGYFRFHRNGATVALGSAPAAYNIATNYVVGDLVLQGGVVYYAKLAHSGITPPNATFWHPLTTVGGQTIYECPNTYVEADIFDIHYAQSADVMTLVHPSYAPRELRRFADTNWILSTISFAATLAGPATVTLTDSLPAGNTGNVDFFTYKVTAIDGNGNESVATSSAPSSAINLGNSGAYVEATWAAVTGATAYNIYKATSYGSFGYIGQSTTTTFRDTNYQEDLALSPPQTDNPFSTDFPRAVSYFEQRRCFAGTTQKPQNLWMTKSGTESNFSFSTPSRDDDGIRIRLAALRLNIIEHLVPVNDLIALSSATEFRVGSINADAITPSTINVRPQSYVGCNKVQPVIVNNNLIFPSIDGNLREFVYSFQVNGYLTGNLCVRSSHLFDNFDIVDMAFTKSPTPIVWCVSSNGKLLGLTYVPEQQVGAWHQHETTNGLFESVCVIRENNTDATYVVVKREIDGNDVRYIERLESREFESLEKCFFVDSGLSYDGSPLNVFAGLDHLEGETVSALVDGAAFTGLVVSGGEVTLPDGVTGEVVCIGLPIVADVETLPFDAQVEGFGQGRQKNISKVWLRVQNSSGVFVGPNVQSLTEFKQRTFEPPGTPPALKTGEIEIVITPNWNDYGRIAIRQTYALPLTIMSITMEAHFGG